MKKSFIILALLLSATVAAPPGAHAIGNAIPVTEVRTTNPDIPGVLVQYLTGYSSRYEEQFLSQTLQPLRQTKSKNSIETADIEKEERQGQTRMRNFTGEQVMRHDRDFDGKVSLAEVRESLMAARRNEGQDEASDAKRAALFGKEADGLMQRYDADKDGVVTLKEASEGGKAKTSRRFGLRNKSQLKQLLELDPDKDGKLTVEELTAIARKAFRAADADGDGMLSTQETAKVREMGLSEPAFGEGCAAPAPAKGDKIVLLSADGGGSISQLKREGENRTVMTVVQVDIAKGEGKLYLVAAGMNNTIWQLTGDTSRVARLLLYGQEDSVTRKLMTGAAGLPADRVSYLKRDESDEDAAGYLCLPPFYGMHLWNKAGKRTEKQAERAVARILGRGPDVIGAFQAPVRIDIATDGKAVAVAAPSREQPAPGDADAATWGDFITLFPGGLVTLKREDVVTEIALEPRGLLPGLAGVAQLVKSGHLQREKDPRGASLVVVTGGAHLPLIIRSPDRPTVRQDQAAGRQIQLMDDSIYRVVKPIDEYPLTYNGYMVRYQLGAGMEKPSNRQGCFIDEAGEEDSCR